MANILQYPVGSLRLARGADEHIRRWHRARPRLQLPTAATRARRPISQDHRLTLLRRFLTDTTILLPTRVAACLVPPFAQPAARLVRRTVHDVLDASAA